MDLLADLNSVSSADDDDAADPEFDLLLAGADDDDTADPEFDLLLANGADDEDTADPEFDYPLANGADLLLTSGLTTNKNRNNNKYKLRIFFENRLVVRHALTLGG